jgi:hypothetical protein
VTPDYLAPRFEDVLKGIEAIKKSLLIKEESE